MEDLLSVLLGSGVRLEAPWKLSDGALTAVVPIVLHSKSARDYLMFEEVRDRVKITDSGSLHSLRVEGDVGKPVFFRGGTGFEGIGTQSRAAQFGIVLVPNAPNQEIKVDCIHASYNIRTGATFTDAGPVSYNVERSLLTRSGQSATWQSVSNYSAQVSTSFNLDSSESADNYIQNQRAVEATEAFKREVEEKLSQIPVDYETQIGIIIVNIRGVLGLEAFDSPESWNALSKSITKKYAAELMEKSETKFYSLNKEEITLTAKTFIESLRQREDSELFRNEISSTHSFKGKNVVGEYTALNGKTIHIVASKTEEEPQPSVAWRSGTWRSDEAPSGALRLDETTQETASFLSKKDGYNLLTILTGQPKTWTELRANLNISEATLHARLAEAQTQNLVQKAPRLTNGAKTYRITAKGRHVKEQAETEYT